MLVLGIQVSVVGDQRGDFTLPVVAGPLQPCTFSEVVFDLDRALVNLHFDGIDFSPQISDIFPIEIDFDPC